MTTTDRLIALLEKRHEAGLKKYGTTMDRRDLTPEEWVQHALEELLDGAGYALRVRDHFEAARRQREAMERFVRAGGIITKDEHGNIVGRINGDTVGPCFSIVGLGEALEKLEGL